MANEYSQYGELVFKEVIVSSHDNRKSDTWFLTGIFLMRQSLELWLKALICRICNRKLDIQKNFEDSCHNLLKLFLSYNQRNEIYLSN